MEEIQNNHTLKAFKDYDDQNESDISMSKGSFNDSTLNNLSTYDNFTLKNLN